MTASNTNHRTSGPSYQATAVILAIVGVCGWVAHGAVAGAAPDPAADVAASDSAAQEGALPPVYLTAPQADAPPIILMLPPAEQGGAGHGAGGRGAAGQSSGAVPGATPVATSVSAGVAPTSMLPGTVAGQTDPGAGTVVYLTAGSTPAASDAPAPTYLTVVPRGDDHAEPGRAPTSHQPGRGAEQTGYQVLATDGSIVYIGRNGQLTANTGKTSSSGVVALGVDGSDLQSGQSTTHTEEASHANGSFQGLTGSGAGRVAAISGFEDHSVSVIGDDQIVTYDDSNVFVDRDGQINANTGDTDSSGLNAVDVVDSRVRAGNSGDSEGDAEDEEEEEEGEGEEAGVAQEAAVEGESADDDEAEPQTTAPGLSAGAGQATVTDEGASSATGPGALVVGADGYDDVSIRSRGNRNLVTYDDSNVVIGGTGGVNAQIGDSDTGGAVVMGIHGSDVEAGCEGDLCYSD